ncbi:hypothetical protein D3C80_1825840 [compost metagenome]
MLTPGDFSKISKAEEPVALSDCSTFRIIIPGFRSIKGFVAVTVTSPTSFGVLLNASFKSDKASEVNIPVMNSEKSS